MPNQSNKNLLQKFTTWYCGQTEQSIGEQIGWYEYNRTHSEKLPPIPIKCEPPRLARILNPIGQFWLRRWPILLPVIVGLIAIAVTLFIYFDSLTNG